VSVAQYLIAVVLLAAIVGALGFGAFQARARWLPSWHGAPARLAEVTGALAVFITVPQLLGTVGWFRRWPVTLALVAISAGVGLVARRAAPRADDRGPITEDPGAPAAAATRTSRRTRTSAAARVATIGAAVLVGIVTAQWLGHVFSSYRDGIHDGDSLWYHLPFATSFFQSGFTTRPLLVGPNSLIAFFPANGETVNGVSMLLFRRDIAVPMISMGWLALALFAGWCLGARYRAGAVGLAAVGLLMDVPLFAATQGGTARNDTMAVALILTAAALVAHANWDPVAIGVAGAATGLAFGVKLSAIPVAALLVVAVLVIAPRGRRLAVSIPFLGGFVLFGAFWWMRNLVRVGNPLPWVDFHLGPLTLSKVTGEDTANSAVIDQLRDSDGISRVLKEGTSWVFGPAWWLFLVVVVGVAVAAVIAGRGRVARALGVVALLGLAAYLVLPNGAPTPESQFADTIFGLNIRYAFPAAVVAIAVAAALPRMERGTYAAGAVVVALALDVTLWFRRGAFERGGEWLVTGNERALAAGLTVLVVVLVAAAWIAGRSTTPRHTGAWVAGAVAVVLVVGSYVGGHMSLDRRYDDTSRSTSGAAWKWAQQLPPTRVGILGNLFQGPYVGPELANHVRYVGVTRDDGGLRNVHTCPELRRALADGDYEYLVTALDFGHSNADQIARVGEWVSSVPGTEVVFKTDIDTVYRLGRPLDPDACP
jgi:hypothetical protein